MARFFHTPVNLVLTEVAAAKDASCFTAAPPCLSSSFLPCCTSSLRLRQHQGRASRRRGPAVQAIELDQDTIVAIAVGLAGIAFGIAVPVFYESQMKGAEKRENDQPCFPCAGSGAQTCRFCLGAGNVTVELGVDEREVSKCVNCEGAGSITCTTCQGSGVQPRYLDRREFKDDD